MGTYILGIAIIVAAAFAVRTVFKDRKGGCGGAGCTGCNMRGACSNYKQQNLVDIKKR